MRDFDELNKLSISSYLESRSIKAEKREGNKTLFSSPFNSDSNPSFVVYEDTNSFFDWSSGFGGSLIDLVMRLDDCSATQALIKVSQGELLPIKTREKVTSPSKTKDFWIKGFITDDAEEIKQIRQYAHSRSIFYGYCYGRYYTRPEGQWISHPSLMFIHRDENMKICGAKFRYASHENKLFTARGKMGFYVLENLVDKMEASVLFLVESETSANSLWELAKSCGVSCVVMSCGSVGTGMSTLPSKYSKITNRKVIIDYDGDEELYESRIEPYLSLGEPLKLILKKGEDINSLYSEGKFEFLKNNIFTP